MEKAVHPDWSGLPEDLTAMVMRNLDIPDLFRAGAVCSSWYAAYSAVRRLRIPITDTSPCLLYSCAADDADTATVYSPSAGMAFKVRLPAPAFRSRYLVGPAHGWVVTAGEASNLQALNPLTGAQVDLPPATGLYHRVYLSCSPSAGRDCVVLLVHKQLGEMSYARLGDNQWEPITTIGNQTVPWDAGYRSAAYNKKDGLWYVLSSSCSVYAFDLKGPSPVARTIVRRAILWGDPTSYIVLSPWGDILHVWRYTTDPCSESEQEVVDPCSESYTNEMKLYKVDVDDQRLVEIGSSDLRGGMLCF